MRFAPAWIGRLSPTSRLPVKVSICTSGCAAKRVPQLLTLAREDAQRFGGMPARYSSSPSRSTVSGASVDGLRITALPAAIAGAVFCAACASGRLNAKIDATTPIGSRAQNPTATRRP
jgi:hypothetical protein